MISEQTTRKVSELMSRYPIWVSPDQSFKETLDIMKLHKVSHLPVCEGKRIIGMISKTDLLERALNLAGQSSGKTFSNNVFHALKNHQIMTKSPIFIKEGETEKRAKEIMMDHMIHALPVVNETLEITGIVTFYDLIK